MAYYEGEIGPIGYGNYGNNNGGWGGNDAWWIIILLIFGLGNNGYGNGGFGGRSGSEILGYELGKVATTNDIASGFNNSAVLSSLNDLKLGQSQGFAGVQQTLCQGFNGINTSILQGFHGVDNAVCTLGYQNQQGFNTLSHQLSDCCCTTQRAIDSVNYNMAKNTCDILQSQNAQTQRIIDYLTCKENQNLRDENFALRLQASQAKQNAYLINEIKPCPIPAYNVPNPNGCYNPYSCSGNNFGGFSVQ